MKRFSLVLIGLISIVSAITADDNITLIGRVKDSFFKRDLTKAYILWTDSAGNVTDTIRANMGRDYRAGIMDTLSQFIIEVPRVDSVYVFDVMCDGYKPQTVVYAVDKAGRRKNFLEIPVTYLERAPRQLKEVTVTASKIKFYNKGDTIVYNADAFQLAEGSMLDALIAQLPGAELNNDGQIKINGQFVESLLLNGKEFFDGNNNLMLENIAAYTVKDIQIYEGEREKDKYLGKKTNPLLTMDVRLKKEYNFGWILNAQGGYGTSDRYMGRLFAAWFSSTWRVSLVGGINNLNDTRKPGRSDTWTPEMLPAGKKEYRNIGLNYNYQNPENTREMEGGATFYQIVDNIKRTTSRINFLPGGNTYEDAFSDSRNRQTMASTRHYLRFGKGTGSSFRTMINGSFSNKKNSNTDLSGVFNSNPGEMSAQILDAIYSNGSPELLGSIINRSKTMNDGWAKKYSFDIGESFNISLGGRLLFGIQLSYEKTKEELWKDYDITYGSTLEQTEKLRQYFDNSPNHNLSISGGGYYETQIKDVYLGIAYQYRFSDLVKDSYMYSLDRLNDMGIYGTLPGNFLETFDPDNSYTSRLITNSHSIIPEIRWRSSVKNGRRFIVNFNPEIVLQHRHFNYWRNNKDYRLSKTNATLNINGIWSGMFEYQFNYKENRFRNSLRLSYSIDPTLPDLIDMLDIVNDADPLNIYFGNPDLKPQNKHRLLFRWQYTPLSHTFQNYFYASYTTTHNALTRGYTYDTSTGVRYNKMYNVDGNRVWAVTNEMSLQFGSKKQFSLSSTTDIIFGRYTDMIGVNLEEPALTTVRNNTYTENIKLGWQIGKQNIGLRTDYTNRQTTSTQQGFNTLNAHHMNAGIQGTFVLPAGFGISTDFTCYTRRGYGVSYLDTTDPIWNLRLSYCPPRNTRWIVMVDGFDMLHQLSNVSYAVTASGRTVSYTNALPRYILFSVQYRLNINPKK